MFHAVSQIGADDDDLISPGIESTTLPMFRESGPTSKRSRGGGNRVAPRGAVVGPREGMPPLRHGKRDLRSRRSASIEMTATNQKFTAPVASSSCFEDPGTFRWDRTATAENTEHHDDERTTEDDRGDDEVQPRGVGLPLRQRRPGMRFRPPPPELENNSARKPWYIIVPDSRTHQLLDHLGDLLTLYVVVAIPLFVSFQHIENMHAEDWYAFNMCVDFLFVVDLMGRVLTAYFDDTAGRLVFRPTSILRHYAGGLLIPDLIASIPLTVILGIKMYTISNKVTRLVRLPQTMRLIRSIKSLSEEAEEARHKNILLAAYNVVKVVMYILLVMHWVACGWHLLADLEDAELSWIVKDGLDGAHASKLYVTSVYWTVTTLSTVGYGDIFASTIAERTYCILVMLTGATMYALAIGSVSQIIATVVARHSQSRRIERHAELFIRKHKLPQDLAVQIMRTLNISGETQAMVEKRAQNTLELVPPTVRTSALLCIYRSQINRIPFLRNKRDVHPAFVAALARSLHDHHYPKAGEEVMFEDSNVEQMVFLVRGRAVITRRGVQVGRMSSGACFGVGAALQHHKRRDSVTCLTDCEVYTVEGSSLRLIARSFPGLVAELKADSERPFSSAYGSTSSSMKPEVRESYSGITPSPLPLGSDASWGKDDGDTPVLSETDSLPTVGRRDSGLLRTSSTKAMRSSRWRRVNSGSGSSGEMGPVHVAAAAASSSVVVAGAAAVTGGGLGVSAGSVSEVGSQLSLQALSRCLAEARLAETEVWDRVHLLNESLKSLQYCLDECRAAHDQVLERWNMQLSDAEAEVNRQSLMNAVSSKATT